MDIASFIFGTSDGTASEKDMGASRQAATGVITTSFEQIEAPALANTCGFLPCQLLALLLDTFTQASQLAFRVHGGQGGELFNFANSVCLARAPTARRNMMLPFQDNASGQ